jgi:hypothetical protein
MCLLERQQQSDRHHPVAQWKTLAHAPPHLTSRGDECRISACFRAVLRAPHAHRALGICTKPSPAKVSRSRHAAYSRTGPRDALPACNRFGLSKGSPRIAHRNYAARYARLVRIRVRTGCRFAPLVRTLLREPGRPPVIKSYGCPALVSTVVSSVSLWFPLATLPGPDQTHGSGSTGRRARSAPVLSVEFNTPCRSQHSGAGYYFDHALTGCKTGVRRNPSRVGV